MLYHNFYSIFNRHIYIKAVFLSLFIVLFSCFSATAQGSYDANYGISVGTDYDAPVGNLAYSFKPATNYNLNLLQHAGNFTGSLSIGYHVYKPKQDTFYYQVTYTDNGKDVSSYGKVSYQNFSVNSYYLGVVYNLELSDQFKMYGGINLGLYSTHFVSHSIDVVSDASSDLHESDVYFAPRLGFSYMLTEHIGLGIEGKYNFFAPTGRNDQALQAFSDDRLGTLYNSWSTGVRLIYNF